MFSPERDVVRQPGEVTTGCNERLQRLGLREDVCEAVLNPGAGRETGCVPGLTCSLLCAVELPVWTTRGKAVRVAIPSRAAALLRRLLASAALRSHQIGHRNCDPEQLTVLRLLAGFADPFDPVRDVTLDNPAYKVFGYSLMKGKLDWLLLRRLAVSTTDVGNHDYSASDHKWLSTDVTFA